MTFFKHSLLVSTSLLFGIHSTWAMEDDFERGTKSANSYSNKKIDYGVKEKKSNKKSFIVTLASTQLPTDQKDESVFQDFVYSWKVETTRPKALSTRMCAEETPFIDLVQLLKLSSSIPHNEQAPLHFTKQGRKAILDLYFQGKLDLTWTRNDYSFNQYCTHKDAPFHTLAVTSREDDVTYYKRQRYSDNSHSEICTAYCDSRFQVEYWKDKESWVVDHPDKGEIEYPTRRIALKILKSGRALSDEERITGAENGVLSFFVHPYLTWMRDKAERENEELPSYVKAGLLGWLALSGDFLNTYLNTPSFKAKNVNDEKEAQLDESTVPSLSTSTNDESSSTSIFSHFSPYSLITPLLVSFLTSKDGKPHYLSLLSLVSSILPKAYTSNSKAGQSSFDCSPEGVCSSQKEDRDSKKSSQVSLLEYGDSVIEEYDGTSLFDESTLEYNNEGKLEQIIAEKTFTNKRGGTIAEVTTVIKKTCEEVFKPVGWKHEDEKLKSYQISKIFAKRTRKNENGKIEIQEREVTGKEKTNQVSVPHEFMTSSFQRDGKFDLNKKGVPIIIKGKICTRYKRPDMSTHTITGKTHEYPVHQKHIKFIHNEKDNFSYQVIRLTINEGGREYVVEQEYSLEKNKFDHIKKPKQPNSWRDDKTNHFSIKLHTIYIDTVGAVDEENIPDNHKIVRHEKEGKKKVFHKKIWLWGPTYWLPGANYEIQHSGEKY